MSDWWLYVVRAGDETLYTGISTDPQRRLQEHAAGVRGARYLRGRAPLSMEYRVCLGERGLALRAEHAFKRLSRAQKLDIISATPGSEALLALLALD